MGSQGIGTEEETRVPVVEDDHGIAESLVRGLRQAGYGGEAVPTGGRRLRRPSPTSCSSAWGYRTSTVSKGT